MNHEIIPFQGWERNLRLQNDSVELIVTLDVGPRILSYKTHRGENVFSLVPEQMGTSGEQEFLLRGGHRLWSAPEDLQVTYDADNDPVEHEVLYDGEVVLTSRQPSPHPLCKEVAIKLSTNSSAVTIRHRIMNEGKQRITLGSWGLTVMAPGGIEIIPQPPLGEHPRDLLPNRKVVFWPYTDPQDTRWRFGTQFFTLTQHEDFPPFKIGLSHSTQWVAYVVGESLFIKTFDFQPDAVYPDGGCNFETFANSKFVEIESLGPLEELAPGESTSHFEQWFLFDVTEPIEIGSEDELASWLAPFLTEAGLQP